MVHVQYYFQFDLGSIWVEQVNAKNIFTSSITGLVLKIIAYEKSDSMARYLVHCAVH